MNPAIRIASCSRSTAALLLAWVLLLILGCSQKQGSEQAVNYPVIDSGYVLADYREPYWLDNDRVIFIGWRPGQPPPKPMEELLDAYIWDTRSNRVTLDMRDAKGVCFFRSEISYTVRPSDGSVRTLRGKFGDARNFDPFSVDTREDFTGPRKADTWLSVCDMNKFVGRPDRKDGRIKVALLTGHGYLDLGDNPFGGDYDIRFSPSDQTPPINLPIRIWQIDQNRLQYVPFKDAYLMYGSRTNAKSPYTDWPKNTPHPIFLLYPSGKVETQEIPYGDHLRHFATSFHVTSVGVLVTSTDLSRLNELRGGSAAYLAQGKRITRVWSRIQDEVSVSPNGCKVIAKVASGGDSSKQPTLQMINLCNTGEQL
jgi:hypothetical protein